MYNKDNVYSMTFMLIETTTSVTIENNKNDMKKKQVKNK